MTGIGADKKAEVAEAQQATAAHTPPGAWPEIHLAGVRDNDGEATYEVGHHRLRVRGPVPAPGAPFGVTVALAASLASAALGRCPACGRVAEIVGPDPEKGHRVGYALLDVAVAVDHHAACVAATDLDEIRRWLLPPYGRWDGEQWSGRQFGVFPKHDQREET